MEYKTLRQLDLKKGDIIEDAQGKRGVVWFVEKDSIKATYPDGNCRHYDMDIAQYKKIIAEPKLEVGQYWHSLVWGNEWLICLELRDNDFECECTKANEDFNVGEKRNFRLEHFTKNDFVLGRHPDKIEAAPKWLTLAECKPCVGDVVEIRHPEREEYCIEEFKVLEVSETGLKIADVLWVHLQHDVRCLRVKSRAAQPEQWQPKEGELVWCVFKNNRKPKKGRVIKCPDTDALGVYYCNDGGYLMDYPISSCEPYDNQDAKIDFSIAGQWVRNDSNVVLITTGETDELIFYGFNPRNGAECKFRSDLFNWKLLTPEQMKPILELIANI